MFYKINKFILFCIIFFMFTIISAPFSFADGGKFNPLFVLNDEVIFELKNKIAPEKTEKLIKLKGAWGDLYRESKILNMMTDKLKEQGFNDKEIEIVLEYGKKGAVSSTYLHKDSIFRNREEKRFTIYPDSLEAYDSFVSPTQQAIISCKGGKETLIIEVAPSEEENFAWVVPLPSYPEVEKGEQGLFDMLSVEVYKTIGRDIRDLYPFYIPGQGITLGGPASTDTVTVHERKEVGAFDVAILSAEKPDHLLNWLVQNQFFIPEKALDAIDFYVKKNWFFVAMKRKISEPKEELHPIKFIFEVDTPVYPMKMTSVEEGESCLT